MHNLVCQNFVDVLVWAYWLGLRVRRKIADAGLATTNDLGGGRCLCLSLPLGLGLLRHHHRVSVLFNAMRAPLATIHVRPSLPSFPVSRVRRRDASRESYVTYTVPSAALLTLSHTPRDYSAPRPLLKVAGDLAKVVKG